MSFYYILAALLPIAFFLGYKLGKKSGVRKGFKEGMFFAPLELKKQLRAGEQCQYCSKTINNDQ